MSERRWTVTSRQRWRIAIAGSRTSKPATSPPAPEAPQTEDRSPQALARRLWELFDAREFDAVRDLLSDDFLAVWPQTRERIEGPENFVALNKAYPGLWKCRLTEIVAEGDKVITEVKISDGKAVVYATSFFTVEDGRIRQAREYFAEPDDPPFDRSQWVRRY